MDTMNNSDRQATMRAALADLYAAAHWAQAIAYDDALLAAYDYAVEFGYGDIEEALSALPQFPGVGTDDQVALITVTD